MDSDLIRRDVSGDCGEHLQRDIKTLETAVGRSRPALAEAARLHAAGKFWEAEALLSKASEEDPDNTALLISRGVMFAAMNQHANAVWCYRGALTRDPRAIQAWTNLGNALTRLTHHKAAVTCHRRAIALTDGKDPMLFANLGISFSEAQRYGEAILAFTRALQINPLYNQARWDRALAYLALGNYRNGWEDYEIRKISGQLPVRELPGREWKGGPYSGKRLLLVSEQGFGDFIWVARYFSRVKALGGELIIQCKPELAALFANMGIADQVVERENALPPADLHCNICSLPGLFTPNIASIPAEPYLTAPRNRLAKFAAAFAQAGPRRKIGIVWSGSTTFRNNHRRAQRLEQFFQAFALPGVQLYSLQKGPPRTELTSLPRGGPIIDLAPLIDDFADTAAAIAQLDLIIMTDSAVAHLAGAMGKPVWMLLAHKAHWLWLCDRTDNPWYPTLRLFRPRAEKDWISVFDNASSALMSMLE